MGVVWVKGRSLFFSFSIFDLIVGKGGIVLVGCWDLLGFSGLSGVSLFAFFFFFVYSGNHMYDR